MLDSKEIAKKALARAAEIKRRRNRIKAAVGVICAGVLILLFALYTAFFPSEGENKLAESRFSAAIHNQTFEISSAKVQFCRASSPHREDCHFQTIII